MEGLHETASWGNSLWGCKLASSGSLLFPAKFVAVSDFHNEFQCVPIRDAVPTIYLAYSKLYEGIVTLLLPSLRITES